ncbi:MAG: AEC family transporter [Amphritea sp.]
MNEILTALWPVFALLLLGYAARRFNFPGDAFWEPAERVTYYVLFPVLLVYKLSLEDISAVPLLDVAAAVVGLLGVGSLLLLLVQHWWPASNAVFTSLYQGGIRFNTYVALATSAALYGDFGLAAAAVVIAVMVPLLNLLCVIVFVRYAQQQADLTSIIQTVIKNPLIIACLLGILLNLSGLGLPDAAKSVAGLLSGMALPLALLAIGAGLNFKSVRSAGWAVIYSSLVKLLVFPLVMALICYNFIDSYQITAVLMLFSALPTAPSAYILARQLGGDAPLMAAIITSQTLLSMLSLPAVLTIFVLFFPK